MRKTGGNIKRLWGPSHFWSIQEYSSTSTILIPIEDFRQVIKTANRIFIKEKIRYAT